MNYQKFRKQVVASVFGIGGWRSTELLASIAAFCGILLVLWFSENTIKHLVFSLLCTFVLVAALTTLTQRLLFSLAVSLVITASIVTISSIKLKNMGMSLHSYDLYFFVGSMANLQVMWQVASTYVVSAGVIAVGIGTAAFFLYRRDRTRIDRRVAGLAMLLFAAAVAGILSIRSSVGIATAFLPGSYVSLFYTSIGESLTLLSRGQVFDVASAMSPPVAPPLGRLETCSTKRKPPHIILIHEESVVPPSNFPGLNYDKSIDPLFLSDDGRLHPLRTEIYGGGSWMTEFSVMAGLSSRSFGSMRTYVFTLAAGGVKESLPAVLERCGYRNVLFLPTPARFVTSDRFYTSIGMHKIFDMKAQGARGRERDAFYFNNMLDEIDRHLRSSQAPIFTMVLTMMPHLPYNETFLPEVSVSGGPPELGAEFNEYMRRISIAAMDYAEFRKALQQRFPNESFLIVQYGDHHPPITRELLGLSSAITDTNVTSLLSQDSPAFVTYYAVAGQNYVVPKMPDVEILDVPYLGSVILDLAGLPLPDSHRERLQLMQRCHGRYASCKDQIAVELFHRRLVDAELLQIK